MSKTLEFMSCSSPQRTRGQDYIIVIINRTCDFFFPSSIRANVLFPEDNNKMISAAKSRVSNKFWSTKCHLLKYWKNCSHCICGNDSSVDWQNPPVTSFFYFPLQLLAFILGQSPELCTLQILNLHQYLYVRSKQISNNIDEILAIDTSLLLKTLPTVVTILRTEDVSPNTNLTELHVLTKSSLWWH